MTGEKFTLEKSFEIVGIVKDSKYLDLRRDAEAMIYVPSWRFWGERADAVHPIERRSQAANCFDSQASGRPSYSQSLRSPATFPRAVLRKSIQ